MIKIKIYEKDNNIFSVLCKGHAGYAESGNDIVCAAVTSIMQMSGGGIEEVIGLKSVYTGKEGFCQILLPDNISDSDMRDCQIVLKILKSALKELSIEYKKYIKMEV